MPIGSGKTSFLSRRPCFQRVLWNMSKGRQANKQTNRSRGRNTKVQHQTTTTSSFSLSACIHMLSGGRVCLPQKKDASVLPFWHCAEGPSSSITCSLQDLVHFSGHPTLWLERLQNRLAHAQTTVQNNLRASGNPGRVTSYHARKIPPDKSFVWLTCIIFFGTAWSTPIVCTASKNFWCSSCVHTIRARCTGWFPSLRCPLPTPAEQYQLQTTFRGLPQIWKQSLLAQVTKAPVSPFLYLETRNNNSNSLRITMLAPAPL